MLLLLGMLHTCPECPLGLASQRSSKSFTGYFIWISRSFSFVKTNLKNVILIEILSWFCLCPTLAPQAFGDRLSKLVNCIVYYIWKLFIYYKKYLQRKLKLFCKQLAKRFASTVIYKFKYTIKSITISQKCRTNLLCNAKTGFHQKDLLYVVSDK